MPANFLKYIGRDKADGFSLAGVRVGPLPRVTSINYVTEDGGNDARHPERRCSKAAPTHHQLQRRRHARRRRTSASTSRARATCSLQVKGGKFVRVFPKKAGTLNCDPKNLYTHQDGPVIVR